MFCKKAGSLFYITFTFPKCFLRMCLGKMSEKSDKIVPLLSTFGRLRRLKYIDGFV